LSGIDIFIVIVFAYNLFLGLTNGLLKSLFGIGAFIVATTMAPLFQGIATNILGNFFSAEQELTKIVGLGFSWFFIYIVINIAASVIIKGMEKTPLKIFDRMAGFLLGVFMSVVIVVVPLLILKAIPILKEIPQVRTSVNHSALLPLFEPLTHPFQSLFSSVLQEQREELMKKLKGNKTPVPVKSKGAGTANEIKKMMKEENMQPLGTINKNNSDKKQNKK